MNGIQFHNSHAKKMNKYVKSILFSVSIFCFGVNFSAGEEKDISSIIQQCRDLSTFDVPMESNGQLSEENRGKFLWDLDENPGASDRERQCALIALWFDGSDYNSITLAWWVSKEDQKLLRILAMSVYNLRWEPISVMLPYGQWVDRFEKTERDMRTQEGLYFDSHASELASVLSIILERELHENPNAIMKRLESELKAVVKNGGLWEPETRSKALLETGSGDGIREEWHGIKASPREKKG